MIKVEKREIQRQNEVPEASSLDFRPCNHIISVSLCVAGLFCPNSIHSIVPAFSAASFQFQLGAQGASSSHIRAGSLLSFKTTYSHYVQSFSDSLSPWVRVK